MENKDGAFFAAAINLRRAIGKSKNYGVGWILKGDDEVVQACRDFDAMLSARDAQGKP